MTKNERKSALSLASIYSFRMLGLFMILPVFAIYAHQVLHATPLLIGLALGIYGLTQACLQIPFGMASDYVGRKPIILMGLILFAIGSLIAAFSHSIEGIIIGRAIQGAGAIGSTLTALVSDLTAEENRLKAMSVIGMTIGLSFIAAMIIGPIVSNLIGVPGIFAMTAVLAIAGIVILYTLVPTPKKLMVRRDSETILSQLGGILKNKELLRLDFGIFTLQAILTAMFLVIPIILLHTAKLPEDHQWLMYLPVLLLAFIAMIPFIIIAESKRKMKQVFVGAVAALTLSLFLLLFTQHSTPLIAITLFIFFTAFTLLEASLPSLVAKLAPAGKKGTAMGIYSSTQFFGIFVGGFFGGIIYHRFHFNGVFLFCIFLGLMWLIAAMTMKKPLHLSSKTVHTGRLSTTKASILEKAILAIEGVADVVVCADEGSAYLKVDKQTFDEEKLTKLIKGETNNG